MNSQRVRWEERYRDRSDGPVPTPSRFLERHLDRLPVGRALDVACGDGRNSLLLARLGFTVEAIDFTGAGLRRLATAARSEGLRVRPIQADLEQFPLSRGRYAVVLNIRYLQRSLLPALKGAVTAGGVVVVETFLCDQREFGHPTNPSFLLERGELARSFADFELLVCEEGLFDTESGPAHLARMLARRLR